MRRSWATSYISHPLIRRATTYVSTKDTMELEFGINFNRWYEINKHMIHPDILQKFKTHFYDEDTEKFVMQSCNIPYCKHMLDNAMSLFLLPFVSSTSRNGILNRGIMFVASRSLFEDLIGFSTYKAGSSILDIGAGDGNVTKNMEHLFSNVYVTESSPPMRYRLQNRGYAVVDEDNWQHERNYDVIACLNVLDRCDDPHKLLEDMYDNLKIKGGKVLIALVLPYHGAVENGQDWRPQTNPLKIKGRSFEEQVSSLVMDVLQDKGFRLDVVTKVPYISSGDVNASYYSINDCLMSLTVQPQTYYSKNC